MNKKSPKELREEREAKALQKNLEKRKQQLQARKKLKPKSQPTEK